MTDHGEADDDTAEEILLFSTPGTGNPARIRTKYVHSNACDTNDGKVLDNTIMVFPINENVKGEIGILLLVLNTSLSTKLSRRRTDDDDTDDKDGSTVVEPDRLRLPPEEYMVPLLLLLLLFGTVLLVREEEEVKDKTAWCNDVKVASVCVYPPSVAAMIIVDTDSNGEVTMDTDSFRFVSVTIERTRRTLLNDTGLLKIVPVEEMEELLFVDNNNAGDVLRILAVVVTGTIT